MLKVQQKGWMAGLALELAVLGFCRFRRLGRVFADVTPVSPLPNGHTWRLSGLAIRSSLLNP